MTLKTKSNPEATSVHSLVVGEADTVASVKDRFTNLQMVPFPDQDLYLSGEVLPDGAKLCDCGLKDGSTLDLMVQATEASLVLQLTNLLQARDLSSDELGLLYCYKHGVSINQALKMLGFNGNFQDFLKEQKAFLFENSRVTLVREDTSLKPFSVADEVARILKSSNTGSMDIKELSAKFAQKFNVSISSIAGIRPVEFLAKYPDVFVISGRGVVSLKSMMSDKPKHKREVEHQGDACAGLQKEAPCLGITTDVALGSLDESGSPDNQQYLDLHTRISGRSFNSKVVQTLKDIVDALSDALFLNVNHVVTGGSVGKGTAIIGVADAQVVFFLKGLPKNGHDKWLPPLLKAVTGVLTENFCKDHGIEGTSSSEDSVQMQVKDLVSVDLHFSPVFKDYAKTIQTLGEQGPDARKFYTASLAKERVQFIARQPGSVKVTMRLMKWWRDQQDWSSRLVRPTDEILELVTVYSAVQTKPVDQRVAIGNVMSLLSGFNKIRIVWSNFYSKDDVWAPLLRQRPLLMDPTNPFVNVADPQAFDARELMELAGTTRFFW